ncbi:hypothetical protein ELH61_13170 [Rhizobium ruizarguesonis]|nr:hypothetical protein ELH61_13170 [Rhizobium ruizarguesonis]
MLSGTLPSLAAAGARRAQDDHGDRTPGGCGLRYQRRHARACPEHLPPADTQQILGTTVKPGYTTDLDRQTMPTSRKIIPEVSGMSPNICQLCIKAVQQGRG